MIYFLSFIVVLGVLIFVHEFGHFIVARKLGVGVTKFSFGFGPKLAGFRRGETEYILSAVPLGGYVKLVGESEGEEVPPEQLARSFQQKPVWVKMAIVAAGPVGNLVFAILVFWIVFLGGVPSLTTRIGDIAPDTPAARAGFRKGDVVLRIDGETVATWEDLATKIRAG
ncbi:MAG: RIP metalloprotease RseP, partial [Deltaproteobacteria bacterium]|nr:RIP metalloprotease RseP [Deltaproteobacteria bacterium]